MERAGGTARLLLALVAAVGLSLCSGAASGAIAGAGDLAPVGAAADATADAALVGGPGSPLYAAPLLGPTRRLTWCALARAPKANVTLKGARVQLPVCRCAAQTAAPAGGAPAAAPLECDEDGARRLAFKIAGGGRPAEASAVCSGKLTAKAAPCYDSGAAPRSDRAWAEVSCCATRVACRPLPGGGEGCLLERR
ncbi:MAG: hypothetical protein J3K34DRAFT_8869 [Monoraphidium minutum]|nr:MAG: hypothetical protein J3K34DRAFT_8869 [Monoraphidium minutum]